MQPMSNQKLIDQSIPIKPASFLHGEPLIQWTTSEVKRMKIWTFPLLANFHMDG